MNINLNKKAGIYFDAKENKFVVKNEVLNIETLPVEINSLFIELLEGIYRQKEEKTKAIVLKLKTPGTMSIIFPNRSEKEENSSDKRIVFIKVNTIPSVERQKSGIDEKEGVYTYITSVEAILVLVNHLSKKITRISAGPVCIEKNPEGWKIAGNLLSETDYMAIREALKGKPSSGRLIKITDKYIILRLNPEIRMLKFEEVLYALLR